VQESKIRYIFNFAPYISRHEVLAEFYFMAKYVIKGRKISLSAKIFILPWIDSLSYTA